MPDDLQPGSPLVMAFHGYGSDAEELQSYSKFDDLVNEEGFVIVYPQGTKDFDGGTNWNVGYNFQNGFTVDDVNFAKVLS